MYGHTLIRNLFLTGTLLWVWGCIPAVWHSEDAYFSGYHRNDSGPGMTVPIVDREALLRERMSRRPSTPVPRPQELPEEDTYSDYSFQDWQRDQQRGDADVYINLSYHLGGPYYYHDFQDRYWRGYMRRYHNLPWYANGWWFDDLWWDHQFQGPYYDPYYGRYDPWYSFYDPWYGYYDPWYGYYYDPFWSYSRQSYYRHHYYSHHGWYSPNWGHYPGGYGRDPDQPTTTTARTRHRNDLPTSMPAGTPSGTGMTTSVRSGSTAASSSGSSAGSTARTTTRKGSSATSSSSSRSSSSDSRASKSSSSSDSKKSSSSKTSRSRNRKP